MIINIKIRIVRIIYHILQYGATPLHVAAAQGHCTSVQALIELGADVTMREKVWRSNKRTYGAKTGYISLLVHVSQQMDGTPLDAALINEHVETAAILKSVCTPCCNHPQYALLELCRYLSQRQSVLENDA